MGLFGSVTRTVDSRTLSSIVTVLPACAATPTLLSRRRTRESLIAPPRTAPAPVRTNFWSVSDATETSAPAAAAAMPWSSLPGAPAMIVSRVQRPTNETLRVGAIPPA
jgi:hypothetical protein